jgi:hypothetical protein
MYDLSQPNDKPGVCVKCKGSGRYVQGKKDYGTCWSCAGSGHQSKADIKRNVAYNVHKVNAILSSMLN